MTDETVEVLDFMLVRPPYLLDAQVARRDYITDTVVAEGAGKPVDVDLQSAESPSAIGRLIFEAIMGSGRDPEDAAVMSGIRGSVLGMLTVWTAAAFSIQELEQRGYVRDGQTIYLLPDRVRRSRLR